MFTSLRAASSVIRGPQRSYATLREIETRLKSIKNIEKITKTMKIVASTRLSKADKAKQTARKYSKADHGFYENAGTAVADEVTGNLIIAITSDKGLCGSIHSQLAKRVRSELNKTPEAKVVAIGDKIKGQLLRSHAKNMLLSISGVGKEAPNFDESALIADQILRKAGNNFNKITVYYNSPLSSLSFEPSTKPVYNVDAIETSPLLSKYEIDADVEVSQDLFEYTLANQIYSAMADGYSAEISARRNAMDNASKNAGDMINRYSILYNRTRQAVITNELVDIITGASSLD